MDIAITFGSLLIQMTSGTLSWISLLKQGLWFGSGFLSHFLAVTIANTNKGFVLVSQGFCNGVPQPWWFRTTEVYCVTVMEVRNPKSR